MENFARREFSPILPSALIGKIFLLCVNDYLEDMATFTTLAKIILPNILQYKGRWAWRNFCPAKSFVHTVVNTYIYYNISTPSSQAGLFGGGGSQFVP